LDSLSCMCSRDICSWVLALSSIQFLTCSTEVKSSTSLVSVFCSFFSVIKSAPNKTLHSPFVTHVQVVQLLSQSCVKFNVVVILCFLKLYIKGLFFFLTIPNTT